LTDAENDITGPHPTWPFDTSPLLCLSWSQAALASYSGWLWFVLRPTDHAHKTVARMTVHWPRPNLSRNDTQ